jgi:mannose-6-phosphate isomerase-like protein (cupin superfamily)
VTVTTGKVIQVEDVAPVRWMGEQGRFLLRGEDTGGLYTFMEITTSPGGGPPLHIHQREDEAFLVLAGAYAIRLGDETHEAGPGGLVYGPRGVPHKFRNIADEPGKMLVIATPGGVEGFFEGLSGLMAKGRPPGEAEMKDLADRHHIIGLEAVPAGRPGGPPPGSR